MKLQYLLTALSLSLVATAQTLPPSPKRPVVDTYFGKAVTDNYRWLEDMTSSQTKDWFKAQGDYSNSVLAQIPGRDALIKTLEQYDALKTATIGEIKLRGGHYFYRKTLPGEKVGKIYYRASLNTPEQLLFDPVAYDKTKTYSVQNYIPSEDGRLVTIALAEGGAEISTMRTMNVETKTFFPESIKNVFGFDQYGWSPDSKGFIYKQLSSANPQSPQAHLDNRTFYHLVGADPATDRELLSRAKYPELGIKSEEYPIVYYNENFTALFGQLATADNRWNGFIAPATDLGKPTIDWKRLATLADSVYEVTSVENRLFFLSRKGALNGRVMVTDIQHPDVTRATIVLPESALNITRLSVSKDYLFVTLSDGINTQIKQYDMRANQWAEVTLPTTGTAFLLPLDPTGNTCLIRMSSWKQPLTVYEYNPVSRQTKLSLFNVSATYPGISDLVVEEIEVSSHDGRSGVPVMVPLSLIYKKGLKKDGRTVCFMTGYGAYGSSATPNFSMYYLALLNKGVLVAITHPRGGSEKGESWHTGGYKTTKPNTWKDFIACGDYVVKQGYTSPAHLIGMGTSAGGILISRAITDRPDLFAAAICNVADCNALRCEYGTDGPLNAAEYGTVKDSTECMALYEMDGLHHVQEGTKYPAVICVGGINDPRVMAWQPGKFAAALQNATSSGKPVLMQVNYDNGHFTEDKAVSFRNFANMYAFALWQAGHPDFQRSDGRSGAVKPVAETKN